MKHIGKQILSLFLAFIFVILSACSGASPAENEQDNTQNIAMGRYIEEECSLPAQVNYIESLVQTSEGNLELIANTDPEKALGPWNLYVSKDQGMSWSQEEAPWLDALGRSTISSIAYDQTGGKYIYYTDMSGIDIEAVMRGEIPPEEIQFPQESFVYVDAQGTVTSMDYQLPYDETGTGVSDIQVAQNGDLLLNTYFSLLQVDSKTGEIKNTFKPDTGYQIGDVLTFGNDVYYFDGDKILRKDLISGEQLETISVIQGEETAGTPKSIVYGSAVSERIMAVDKDHTAIYYCDSTGLYRRLLDGSMLEKLINGELTSLNMPSMTTRKFFVLEDGNFLIYYKDEEKNVLLKYAYQQDVPSVPTTELKVYSLEDNQTIRQAMGLFQRANPDTHVTYTVGMTGEDAVTVSDALRTLSTQLLAGKGPDVIVLDGMPIDSYIEKNVLLDLSEYLKKTSGELLSNIAVSYQREDKKTYAVPGRFMVPMMLGEASTIDQITNLTQLADWLEKEKDHYARPLEVSYPANLIRQFYPVCAPAWIKEDGSIKTEEFSQFLKDIQRISQLEEKAEDISEENLAQIASLNNDLVSGSIYWKYDQHALALGDMNTLSAAAAPDAAIRDKGVEGRLAPLTGQVSGIFVPKCILGVNQSSMQKDLSLAFIDTVLSQEVQDNDFEDGMPVNSSSFKKAQHSPYSEEDDGMYYSIGYVSTDDETEEQDDEPVITMEMQIKWPSEQFMNTLADQLEGLSMPVTVDRVVLDTICQETVPYFEGTRSLEDTVTAVTEKLRLYLFE